MYVGYESRSKAVLIFFADKRGNRALIGITAMNFVLYFLTWIFYRTINKRRDRVWKSMTAEVSFFHFDLGEPYSTNSSRRNNKRT